MSLPGTVGIACPKCGLETETTVWKSVNVTLDPQLREDFFSRDLNIFSCPCGNRAEIDAPLLYHDMTHHFMVWLITPDFESESLDLDAPELKVFQGLLPTIRHRTVRTRNELVEKILIFEAELDDRVIEVLKAGLWAEMIGEEDPPADRMFFTRWEQRDGEEDLVLFSHMTDDGEKRILWAGYESAYEYWVNKLQDMPNFKWIEGAGWVRVDRDFAIHAVQELIQQGR